MATYILCPEDLSEIYGLQPSNPDDRLMDKTGVLGDR